MKAIPKVAPSDGRPVLSRLDMNELPGTAYLAEPETGAQTAAVDALEALFETLESTSANVPGHLVVRTGPDGEPQDYVGLQSLGKAQFWRLGSVEGIRTSPVEAVTLMVQVDPGVLSKGADWSAGTLTYGMELRLWRLASAVATICRGKGRMRFRVVLTTRHAVLNVSEGLGSEPPEAVGEARDRIAKLRRRFPIVLESMLRKRERPEYAWDEDSPRGLSPAEESAVRAIGTTRPRDLSRFAERLRQAPVPLWSSVVDWREPSSAPSALLMAQMIDLVTAAEWGPVIVIGDTLWADHLVHFAKEFIGSTHRPRLPRMLENLRTVVVDPMESVIIDPEYQGLPLNRSLDITDAATGDPVPITTVLLDAYPVMS